MRKSAPLFCALLLSLSARRAWIEMYWYEWHRIKEDVALRKESVDRNIVPGHDLIGQGVALRKESVDRNFAINCKMEMGVVALRKESVDRNIGGRP